MRIPVGIYDFVAYTIPGAVYVMWVLLSVQTAGLTEDVWSWLKNPTLVQAVVFLLASYLLGHVTYVFAKFRLPYEPRPTLTARENFKRRNPELATRPFLGGDSFTLLAAIEAKNMQLASTVTSVRATSLMCRNCATPLALIAITLLLRIERPVASLPSVPCAVALIVVALLLRHAGVTRELWAHTKTLECAAWIEGIDAAYQPASAQQAPQPIKPDPAPAPEPEETDDEMSLQNA